MSFCDSWNFRTMPRHASLRPFSAHHQVRYFTVTGIWAVERRATARGSAVQPRRALNPSPPNASTVGPEPLTTAGTPAGV